MSFIFGYPIVKVPVLSKTTVVNFFKFSSTLPPSLSSTPKLAATPVPTMTAVGVARPKAQGQAMTNVEIPKLNAKIAFVLCSLSKDV